jgi:hypothetical protein
MKYRTVNKTEIDEFHMKYNSFQLVLVKSVRRYEYIR